MKQYPIPNASCMCDCLPCRAGDCNKCEADKYGYDKNVLCNEFEN